MRANLEKFCKVFKFSSFNLQKVNKDILKGSCQLYAIATEKKKEQI